jgi:hypothetical protein
LQYLQIPKGSVVPSVGDVLHLKPVPDEPGIRARVLEREIIFDPPPDGALGNMWILVRRVEQEEYEFHPFGER